MNDLGGMKGQIWGRRKTDVALRGDGVLYSQNSRLRVRWGSGVESEAISAMLFGVGRNNTQRNRNPLCLRWLEIECSNGLKCN